jgi:hypothetical protein
MDNYKEYVEEIKWLLTLPDDANTREGWGRDYEPETPEERLIAIAGIFDIEDWDWPTQITPRPNW